MSKEYYDTHVVGEDVDWSQMMADSSSETSETCAHYKVGNLSRWSPQYNLSLGTKKKIQQEGPFYSTSGQLVNPYTGDRLGVNPLNNKLHPYYVVHFNVRGMKDPAYITTMSPEEYNLIMSTFSPSFIPADSEKVRSKWVGRVQEYNKKYPKNKF